MKFKAFVITFYVPTTETKRSANYNYYKPNHKATKAFFAKKNLNITTKDGNFCFGTYETGEESDTLVDPSIQWWWWWWCCCW